jgi:hypothetical protein
VASTRPLIGLAHHRHRHHRAHRSPAGASPWR